ncbi:MAG: beta-galactosidase [Lachnospiraceae bacterium]|nr:beta-galactosidase [Lachnospiraceae bacterium]
MRKQQNYQWPEITLGTCYYPEHWERGLWAKDLERMLASGITTIRIGEFAWSKVEPEEGRFTYEFFDDFLAVVASTPMKVIFGTPTATPPAWLTNRYPEVLNCRIDGVKYQHGMRRHYNYNSPVYRKFCKRIVEKLGEHYAKHPNVVGWQIDNEINCETAEFYSDSDIAAFRKFLQRKYETLEKLNTAWGAVFWNQEYTDWEEIYVPRLTIHNSTNPHQMLDYIRFISDSAVSFCKMQSDILRKYVKPGDFITTNGMFQNMDNHRMTDEALDVYTYDSYPNFAYCLTEDPKHAANLNDRRWSNNLSQVRSVCPHFGIMEQQSGANGWNTRMEAPAPKPGQMMLWAMQSIAHGADFVSFFRWRTSVMGTEIYWHGILDYDNRDNRKLEEVRKIYKRVQTIKDLAGASYRAAFGIVQDYSNIWDSQVDVWHQRLVWSSEEEIFIASQIYHTPMDYVYLLEDTQVDELVEYPVLFYPHGLILSEQKAAVLKEYVEQGGCLILGARTGLKDETGKCVMTPMPGLLAEITGSDVKDFTFVGPADEEVLMEWNGQKMDTGIFHDILDTTGEEAMVLARYTSDYYKGRAALVENTFGKGKVLHFGGTFTRENVKAFLAYAGILEPWNALLDVPEGCEIGIREKGGKNWIFVLNYMNKEQEITLKAAGIDLDTEERVQGRVRLSAYETKVYQIDIAL